MTSVVLYGKAGCHLCEEARETVGEVRAERGFDLTEVDITADPRLHARYRERIPVIEIDGREELELVIDAEDLRERLDRVAS
jgi:glutaredoxin